MSRAASVLGCGKMWVEDGYLFTLVWQPGERLPLLKAKKLKGR